MSLPDTLPVSFSDTSIAYAYKSTPELRQAQWMFRFLNMPVIGPIGKGFLKFAIKIGLPVKAAIKATLYKQFVGGETLDDCLPLAEKLAKFHVKSILDYSEEGKESETDWEHAYKELLNNIKFSASHEGMAFAVFKPTAFISTALLEKVSNDEKLDAKEDAAWKKGAERFETLCRAAYEGKLPVMIDAEESWIQNAIDRLAYSMMEKYNREKVYVLNTIQFYRKGRVEELRKQYDIALQKGYKLGVKIVRGAYMEKERARALKMNIASPINDTKQDTDTAYNQAIHFCFEHLENIMVFIGTHNEISSRMGAALLDEKGHAPSNPGVWFSQLYGMSDNISFNLAAKGYNVAKYVPYGPVASVTPYLIRRAEENSSVAGQALREIKMLKEEIAHRKRKKE